MESIGLPRALGTMGTEWRQAPRSVLAAPRLVPACVSGMQLLGASQPDPANALAVFRIACTFPLDRPSDLKQKHM